MHVFDLISQEEIDDLPEDNNFAFMEFVRHCRRRLDDRATQLNGNDEGDWHIIQDDRQGFMNIVLAAAKRFDIEPFASRPAPYRKNFDVDDYLNFLSDLDHYTTQLVLDRSIRSRAESTALPTVSKDRIRSHLHHLRDAINSSGLNDAQKAALHRKVDEFDAELEKRRINLLAVARLSFEILAIPGAVWASYDVTTKLLTNIMQTVAEAKVVEDDQRKLPLDPKPFALMPPRPPGPKTGYSRDLDDEIPF